jgi:hypothetical protein
LVAWPIGGEPTEHRGEEITGGRRLVPVGHDAIAADDER